MSLPYRISRLLLYFRQIRSAKLYFVASCMFVSSIYILHQASIQEPETEYLVQEALENVGRDIRYRDVYRKTSTLPKGIKYILLWTRNDYAPFYHFGEGQRAFLSNNCSVTNCYITSNRALLDGDITKFDAIAFNGRNMRLSDLPKTRSLSQKYIYVNTESADNFPLCDRRYDNFFNWTATYRLDSDIPMAYLLIKDKKGRIVGPKRNMKWIKYTKKNEIIDRVGNKTKAAAWFVSHCATRSKRKEFIHRLQESLKVYRQKVDVYGACGTMKCPRTNSSDCDYLLERDYFFYMSLENTFADDYVTEKLLRALQTDIVPIVYGGADYSRFLPPNSYINGRNYSPSTLAAFMNQLMHSSKDYTRYFWWKSHYTYHSPESKENVCALCAALNSKKISQESSYSNLRQWWHPSFKKRCRIKG